MQTIKICAIIYIMGLFHILKNGLTIEKKKVQAEPELDNETETTEEEISNEVENTTPTQTAFTAESNTSYTQPTLEAQRQEAASVLLGDNGLTHGTTPSLIQVAQSAPTAQTTATTITNETASSQQQIFNTHNNLSGNFDHTLLGTNQNLLVIAPQSSAEISTILTNLANGNNCIVSLSKFSLPEAQRFLDYICGFVNAIGGTIMQRSASEFILAPKGVNIKNS